MRLSLKIFVLTALWIAPATAAEVDTPFTTAIASTKKQMMADPAAALTSARRAEALARAAANPEVQREQAATAKWLEGEALTRVNRPSEALPIIAAALALVGPQAPKLHADLILARATAEGNIGDIRGALDDYQIAWRGFGQLGDRRGQAKALMDIAGIYSDAEDYERALHYYALVPEIYHGDAAVDLAAHNNLGETLKKLGRYRDAEREANLALAAAQRMGSRMLKARVFTNLATDQLLDGSPLAASQSAGIALALTKSNDAAGWRPSVYGVMAQIALAENDLPRARTFIERTFAGVDLGTSPATFREFHDTAFQVYQRLGSYDLALRHHIAFKRLADEAHKLTASMSAAVTSAQFDFANQNLRISRLQSERAQKAAQLASAQAHLRTQLLTILLFAGFILLAVLSFAVLSIRRSRNKERQANSELLVANGSLEKALQIKTEFLATTSHEIRTPLNGIIGMTQVLLSNPLLECTTRERIEVVHDAGERMRALVDDILDMAKIESGSLEINKQPMNLMTLLSDVGRLWQDQATEKGLSVYFILEDAPEMVCEDEPRLRQILTNLMSNAIKFTESGSITLCAFVRGGRAGAELVITVRDTGIGIADEAKELVFETFRQADGSTNRRFGGTGLGLTICRRYAQAMGGDVTVESVLNIGSVFELWLPLQSVPENPHPRIVARQIDEPVRFEDAKVLLVEENLLTQKVMEKLLRPHAAAIVSVVSLEAAIVKLQCQAEPFHLLIDDKVLFDRLDEFPVSLESLCHAVHDYGGRISVLTNKGMDVDSCVMITAVADQLIAKPIDGLALIEALIGLYTEPAQAQAA